MKRRLQQTMWTSPATSSCPFSQSAMSRASLATRMQARATPWAIPIARASTIVPSVAMWAETKAKCPWTLSAPELVIWAESTAGNAKSVPRQLFAGLKWASSMYLLPWTLEDPLIQATEGLSAREAAAKRKQAAPYDQRTTDDVEDFFKQADTCSEKYIAGFLLVLALGVLRFSDLNRSSRVTLGRDSLHGLCWKCKKKIREMPWAMLRHTARGSDLGAEIIAIYKQVLPLTAIGGQAESWETLGVDLAAYLPCDGDSAAGSSQYGRDPTTIASACKAGCMLNWVTVSDLLCILRDSICQLWQVSYRCH